MREMCFFFLCIIWLIICTSQGTVSNIYSESLEFFWSAVLYTFAYLFLKCAIILCASTSCEVFAIRVILTIWKKDMIGKGSNT